MTKAAPRKRTRFPPLDQPDLFTSLQALDPTMAAGPVTSVPTIPKAATPEPQAGPPTQSPPMHAQSVPPKPTATKVEKGCGKKSSHKRSGGHERGRARARQGDDSTSPSPPLRRFTPEDAADMLAVSVKTLEAWRRLGKGPRFVKLGRAVRYALEDLEDFSRARTVNNSAEGRMLDAP